MKDSLGTTTWSRAWIIEALLWINQKHGCTVDALALVVVVVDGIMWLSGWGVCPDFPLITVQDQRAISWGGWEVFSVPVSLHQHQREISMPCWSVCVYKCVYMLLLLLFSPPPRLCYWEEKGWAIAIVTMPQLIGRTVVVVVPLARCGECAEIASQIWKLWDEALRGGSRTCACLRLQWSPPGTQEESFWATPILCHPGSECQLD